MKNKSNKVEYVNTLNLSRPSTELELNKVNEMIDHMKAQIFASLGVSASVVNPSKLDISGYKLKGE